MITVHEESDDIPSRKSGWKEKKGEQARPSVYLFERGSGEFIASTSAGETLFHMVPSPPPTGAVSSRFNENRNEKNGRSSEVLSVASLKVSTSFGHECLHVVRTQAASRWAIVSPNSVESMRADGPVPKTVGVVSRRSRLNRDFDVAVAPHESFLLVTAVALVLREPHYQSSVTRLVQALM